MIDAAYKSAVEAFNDLKEGYPFWFPFALGALSMYLVFAVGILIVGDEEVKSDVKQTPEYAAEQIIMNAKKQANIMLDSAKSETETIYRINRNILELINDQREYEKRKLRMDMIKMEIDTKVKERELLGGDK